MCEKCGFSGCNHDWKKWQPNWYSRGYDDALNGRSANPPELMLGESGYMAGYEHAQRDYRKSVGKLFPADIELLCGHGQVTVLYPCNTVKCGVCGVVTPMDESRRTQRAGGLPTTSADIVESIKDDDEREDMNPLFYGSR